MSVIKQRVLLLTDGIQGHQSQSEGVLNWLGDAYELDVQIHTCKLRHAFITRIILALCLNMGLTPTFIFKVFYRFDFALLEPSAAHELYDWVIAAGGKTSFLCAYLGKAHRLKSIFIGSPRRLKPSLFDVLITNRKFGTPNNLITQITPSVPASTAYEHDVEQDLSHCFLLSLGGNGDGIHYKHSDMLRLANFMNQVAAAHNINWILVTSRRTGTKFETLLANQVRSDHLALTLLWSDSKKGQLQALMQRAQRVFVTHDSMTMLVEAIGSGKPTTLLRTTSANPSAANLTSQNRLLKAGFCDLSNTSFTQPSFSSHGIDMQVIKDEFCLRFDQLISRH